MNICNKYSSNDIPPTQEMASIMNFVRNEYAMADIEKIPIAEKISLNALPTCPPFIARATVIAGPTTAQVKSQARDCSQNLYPLDLYNSARTMPAENSHRYCKQNDSKTLPERPNVVTENHQTTETASVEMVKAGTPIRNLIRYKNGNSMYN